MANKLLTRDEFREGVFARDSHTCVFCDKDAVDAHHILERRLWPDGGYYLDNGASVCEEHHIMCEKTLISVDDVRLACGIIKPIIPPHMYSDVVYDKWGNIMLPNGSRLRGELFFDESVQKILGQSGILSSFIDYVKYPRTFHLPWSEGLHDDDRMHESMDQFNDRTVVVTEKLDGENTSMYRDYIHARSIDSRNHESRNWVKNFWSSISHDIPSGWRICGENMFAEHSIEYNELESYFYGFSIWDDVNNCLNWDDTLDWFDMLGIIPVPILYYGPYDEKKIRNIKINRDISEGYVLRLADSFNYAEFKKYVGKYVRKDHIQTAKHWMYGQRIKQNKLK